MHAAISRRPSLETFEPRQLMAADLAVAADGLAPSVDAGAYVATDVVAGETSGQLDISNGLRPHASQVALSDLRLGDIADVNVILETTRPKDNEQLRGTLSAEQLQVAVDRVFAESESSADSQLSDEERAKWEALILESLRELEAMLEVRWQYAGGEGGLVTESFGPNEEWPI